MGILAGQRDGSQGIILPNLDPQTGKSKAGEAFVRFIDRETAEKAIQTKHREKIGHRWVQHVVWSWVTCFNGSSGCCRQTKSGPLDSLMSIFLEFHETNFNFLFRYLNDLK